MKYLNILTSVILVLLSVKIDAQSPARIYEENRAMQTYPFSQPDPVAKMGNIYPYFRFDGYTNQGVMQNWKMVVLENDYIKVYVTPEIGGKIWGAIEKSTGQEFLYFNEVVKFRDIAMRGPWTSGGLEYNFGDIGHIPTASTPVDYVLKENTDGSVSCIVGAIDLPSRTKWNVSINLHPDKAYVETVVHWQNSTALPVTYYHWMNAAAKASGNLKFLYPGNAYIGHGGEVYPFPQINGKDVSYYENNNFGPYKSYHVLNAYSNFFGGYWLDDNFGFGHAGAYDEKPGKKLWIWGLSDQGMIWEDLLTDNDGQYIEYQAGKLFNQAAAGSTQTPFKHREFAPFDVDRMTERWFPLKETKGMVATSEQAVLNVVRSSEEVKLFLQALQPLQQKLVVLAEGKTLAEYPLSLQTMELYTTSIKLPVTTDFEVRLGNQLLTYQSKLGSELVQRPLEANQDFDWTSAYGLFIEGLELEKQRNYVEAQQFYQQSLQKEAGFAPALNRLALSFFRQMEYAKALGTIKKSLAINTYDPEANYIYGLVQEQLGKVTDAKSAYSIATQGTGYRVAAYTALAQLFLKEKAYHQALNYTHKALTYNQQNIIALEMLVYLHRIRKEPQQAKIIQDKISDLDATNTFIAHEKDLLGEDQALNKLISNELPQESYLELAATYLKYGDQAEAVQILKRIPEAPIALLWLAVLDPQPEADYLEKALNLSTDLVFPHRVETLQFLEDLMTQQQHWKLSYYTGLILWYKGRLAEAQESFKSCKNQPDATSFYLTKARIFSKDLSIKTATLQKAVQLGPNDWRAHLALANELYEQGEYKQVSAITARFLTENPAFGMLYTKALLRLNTAAKAVDFLDNYEILPFEGARDGRLLFQEACIQAALDAYTKKTFKRTLEYTEKAMTWPRNLGVGKPYDVDTRMEYYLLAQAYAKLKDQQNQEKYELLLETHPLNESPLTASILLQSRQLQQAGKKEALQGLLNAVQKKSGSSELTDWVEQQLAKAPNTAYKVAKEASVLQKLVVDILNKTN